ncbi:type VI secretion system baseplate subunit TssG [Thalassomonas haliotis]|uniref:Type VI secretion system baseplate subunit TssG n=1 Tax=Thalassomonas haliotis TaxID=485448 RepID=A0ABY7V7Z2_9GAMM|nr:type VI secretion system baseplate subunit TssG [Thalassomonas haliotis]WDE09385.1 type VI secretion system baseplate subunit TssG [Thalassomonas haliotis]
MASAHWRTGYSVADLYTKIDADWSFYQLVRLLLPAREADERLLSLIHQYIDFNASSAQDFPPGEIREVRQPKAENDQRQKTQIICSRYNIAGCGGPLPEAFVEMLQDDIAAGKGAMQAFIDLFNNRIQALRYLIRARTDHTLARAPAQKTESGRFLLSLSGHLSEQQQKLHHQGSDTLIGLAGDLANTRMTLPTMSKLFDINFNLPLLDMKCFQGRWLRVESSDHTLLGRANQRLGEEATLGRDIWDQQAVFELVLGPMSADRLNQLVPGGLEHNKLRRLVQWICDIRCDCKITLVCDHNIGCAAVLSKEKRASNVLGLGSWLSSQTADKETGNASGERRVSFMLNLVH